MVEDQEEHACQPAFGFTAVGLVSDLPGQRTHPLKHRLTASLSADNLTSACPVHNMTSILLAEEEVHQVSQMYRKTVDERHPLSSADALFHHQSSSYLQSTLPLSALPLSPCRHLQRLFLLSLTLATLTAVAVGVSSLKKEYILQIGVPETTLIRKVRTFSRHPELSELVHSESSLSLVSRLQLLDLHGCQDNLSQCQTVAVCDGGENTLLCRCRRGYYFHDLQCKECMKSCPEGHYLISPCSANSNAICTACTKCSGSQYEAAVCTTTRDTICVDVSFPVGILPLNGTPNVDDGTPITVSYSSNVFMERLLNMKELETPMYVTNNQQTQDFVWHRESGIDIVVGISGVYLIPEYRELDVDDDSQFFLAQTMIAQSTLDLFSNTKKYFCRHPVPDYYYLHLEVIKNRTAAAQVVRCDSKDAGLPKCPASYKDGDRFLKWDINRKCDKYAATGETSDPITILRDGFNIVVCADETKMDREIFKRYRPATLEMMFPSAECSQYHRQCDICLSSSSCPNENDDKSCCGLSCYKQGACHQFYSPSCSPAVVECASGEIHMFTILPVFTSMATEFKCHLRYQQPAYLYNISYSLAIPGLGFQVPVQNYTASTQNLLLHQHHSGLFHFIQIWHDMRMSFSQDLLLKGTHEELEKTRSNHMQPYVVHSLKENGDFSRQGGFIVNKKSNSEFTTAVQFEHPFLYSSTSFYRNGCNKNMSQIFPNQTLYKNDAMKVIAKKVGKENNYTYQISHSERSPYIKLSVKEGESVLRWFQGTVAKGTIIGQHLSASLSWDSSRNHWTVGITGAVKNCPAILTLQVFSKMISSCAGIYDIVVACPNNFSLTLNITRSEDDLPDIFAVFLNDTQASHCLILSSVIAPINLAPVGESVKEGFSRLSNRDLMDWCFIFMIVILFSVVLMALFIAYLHIKRKTYKVSAQPKQPVSGHSEPPTLNNQSQNLASQPVEAKEKQLPLARTCMCIFVALYVVYSIIFTFSLMLVILYFTCQNLMGDTSVVANFSAEMQKELNASFHKVQSHESQEEIRLFQSVESRLQACSYHLKQQNHKYLQAYHDTVTDILSHVFQKDGAIESLASQSILQNASIYAEEIDQFLMDCNRTVQSILDRFDSHFEIHVKEVVRNGWLDYPREIFLTQEGDPADRLYMSSDQLTRFLHWLQVDKSDELLQVSDLVAARLASLKLPSPTDHLHHAFSTQLLDLAASLPPEPVTAGHTFLVLQSPDAGSPSPVFYTTVSTASMVPSPEKAFLYSEGQSARLQFQDDSAADSSYNEEGRSDSNKADDKDQFGVTVFVAIGLFLFLDILLFAFRMSWMVNQVRASKGGYEDRIPTDPESQKLLAIQTGYHINCMQDMYQSYNYCLENKENINSEERGSESEFNVYFCQAYPKSKDDILREIMAQKMNSAEPDFGQERSLGEPAKRNGQGLSELLFVREMTSCCRWLHRMLISQLVWRFVLTAVLVLFLCLLVYAADFWLTADNLRVLVGGQSAVRDLHLQVHMTNHHLVGLASHLNAVLEDHRSAVQSEVSLSTTLLSSTLQTQRELLVGLLERVCEGAGTPACNVSSYSSLPLPDLPSWQACNFLPAQPHLYQDIGSGSLEHMVAQQLSPLLDTVRHSLFSLCAILIAFLCIMFLCHASAIMARYYMLVSGYLPRVQVFQLSENVNLYDGVPTSHAPMQRSASWLESCESGVYVGESEMDNNPNRDV